ncbi:MAG: hypothetical protein KME17_28550 [Cyanosarcina radialis HA8281-LM2]|jgi:hypothetical protein|nr:hypothetical protein [Cyanosarcina radialis HA8281-LM2]
MFALHAIAKRQYFGAIYTPPEPVPPSPTPEPVPPPPIPEPAPPPPAPVPPPPPQPSPGPVMQTRLKEVKTRHGASLQ